MLADGWENGIIYNIRSVNHIPSSEYPLAPLLRVCRWNQYWLTCPFHSEDIRSQLRSFSRSNQAERLAKSRRLWGSKKDRNKDKNKHIGRCGRTGETESEAIARGSARKSSRQRNDWRGVPPLCRLGSIRMPLWNCCNDALSSVPSSWSNWGSHAGPIPPSAADRDNEQEQRQRVGEILLRQRLACGLGSHLQGQDQIT